MRGPGDTVVLAELRSDIDILVTHAHAIGNIAVVRSLGRAGFRVHAATSDPGASVLRSNHVSFPAVHPDYESREFVPWVLDYVARHNIRVIIPSEGFLVASQPIFQQLASLMPLPSDWTIVERSFSKTLYFDAFLRGDDPQLRRNIPPSLILGQGDAVPATEQLAALGLPMYVKVDEVLDLERRSGGVFRADTVAAGQGIIAGLLGRYRGVLVQGSVPGVKATYNVCLHDGEVLAESMCFARHESPHSGGLTVLRETFWNDGMREDALRRLRAMNWDGVAMMEYKWDAAHKRFCFIEANTRFWAALHLDLFAGTDFPLIQVEAFLGLGRAHAARQRLGVVARHTVPGDTSYLISKLRDPGVSLAQKCVSAAGFCLIGLDPRVKADLLFPGDRKLYFLEWRRFLCDLLRFDRAG
jgi:hypothetical protein